MRKTDELSKRTEAMVGAYVALDRLAVFHTKIPILVHRMV